MDQSTEVGPRPGQVLLGSCLRGFQIQVEGQKGQVAGHGLCLGALQGTGSAFPAPRSKVPAGAYGCSPMLSGTVGPCDPLIHAHPPPPCQHQIEQQLNWHELIKTPSNYGLLTGLPVQINVVSNRRASLPY